MFNIAGREVHQAALDIINQVGTTPEVSPISIPGIALNKPQLDFINLLSVSYAWMKNNFPSGWLESQLEKDQLPENFESRQIYGNVMRVAHYNDGPVIYDHYEEKEKANPAKSSSGGYLNAHFQEWAVDKQISTNSYPHYNWFGAQWLTYTSGIEGSRSLLEEKEQPAFLLLGSLGIPSTISFAQFAESINPNSKIIVSDLDIEPTSELMKDFKENSAGDLNIPQMDLLETDARSINMPDNSVSFIATNYLFPQLTIGTDPTDTGSKPKFINAQSMHDIEPVLKEIYRVLEINGCATIVERPIEGMELDEFRAELIATATNLGFRVQDIPIFAINYDYKTKKVPEEDDFFQVARKLSSVSLRLVKN